MISREDKYLYKVFGLNIVSDFCLPEIPEWDGKGESDVNIVRGLIQADFRGTIYNDDNLKVTEKELVFYVDGVSKYYISEGNTIVIEPDGTNKIDQIKIFLLGSALGIILLQRGLIPIHGSAVIIDGKGIIITGASGAGKSTLSSVLRKKGYIFLADDISTVTIDEDGYPIIHPGYAQQKLWKDSLVHLGESSTCLCKVKDDEEKYIITVEDNFSTLPVPLYAVFELNQWENQEVESKQIMGTDKVGVMLRNIYREQYLKIIGLKSNYFKKCLDVSRDVKFFRIRRPNNLFTIEDQIKLIMANLEPQI